LGLILSGALPVSSSPDLECGNPSNSHLVLLSLVTYDLFVRRILPLVCIFFTVAWQVAPGDISAVYRLLALYYPHLDLDEIRMKLDVGTDLAPESLFHYGLAGYNESNVRQGRAQEVLDKLRPRKAIGLVTVGYLPPLPVHEDDIEDGDFSRYMMRENVGVEIYLDRGRLTESELGQLKQQVSRASGMLFEEDGSVTIREFVERGVGPRG
jgi:hypothetical protein